LAKKNETTCPLPYDVILEESLLLGTPKKEGRVGGPGKQKHVIMRWLINTSNGRVIKKRRYAHPTRTTFYRKEQKYQTTTSRKKTTAKINRIGKRRCGQRIFKKRIGEKRRFRRATRCSRRAAIPWMDQGASQRNKRKGRRAGRHPQKRSSIMKHRILGGPSNRKRGGCEGQ